MRILVFDIETAPQPALRGLAEAASQARKPTRGSEIVLDEDEASQDRLQDEIAKEMALSPLYGQVVALGAWDAQMASPHLWVGGDEREMLEEFWGYVQGCDLFVSWNGLAFDVPWLYVRSMILGVEPTARISAARYRYPGESNHVDLYALLTDWRGNRTKHLKLDLATVARILGVEPPVGDGADVPRLWELGDVKAIRKHLASDLRATLGIWERLGCPGLVRP